MAKKRVTSVDEQTKAIQQVAKGIKLPEHLNLRERDYPFWNSIIQARAEWTDVDLVHAANLARCQSDIELYQKQLDIEGAVVINAKGTQVMNPLFTVLEQLSRRSVALCSKIQVHAAATVGEAKNAKGKNRLKREAAELYELMEEDDLIAKPLH